MGKPITFRIKNQAEFTSVLKKYSLLSSRTPAEICNRKAYFISRRAIWHTHKTDYQKMANELGQILKEVKRKFRGKSGQVRLSAKGQAQFNSAGSAPLLSLMINARLGRKGQKGLYGSAMKEEFKTIFGARARSIAFIKSGFIEARDIFKKWCQSNGVSIGGKGLPPYESSGIGGPKQLGSKKLGGAIPAVSGRWIAKAIFWNSANAKRDHEEAVIKYGEPGLQKGFDEETVDTMREVEKRLKEHAHACGIRTR